MILETFMKSGILTLAGMAVVFAFMLCMMVLVSSLVRISARFFPDAESARDSTRDSTRETPGIVSGEASKGVIVDQDAIVAAIAAGIRARK